VAFGASSARAQVIQTSATAVNDAAQNDRRPLLKRFFMVLPVVSGSGEQRQLINDGRPALLI